MHRAETVGIDSNDLTGLYLALVHRTNDVEGARFRREHPTVTQASHDKRPPAVRIARDEHRVVQDDQQAVRPFHVLQRLRHPRFRRRAVGPGDAMHDHLGIHGRREDRAAIFEFAPQFDGVRQIAVVGERDMAPAYAGQNRLRVLDRRGTGRAVPRVTDRDRSTQRVHLLVAESFRDKAHRATDPRMPRVVDGNDARRLLTAMLQRIQAELR